MPTERYVNDDGRLSRLQPAFSIDPNDDVDITVNSGDNPFEGIPYVTLDVVVFDPRS